MFPSVLTSLRDSDEYVRKNTATLIREIAKHTPEVNMYITAKSVQRHTNTSTVDPLISEQQGNCSVCEIRSPYREGASIYGNKSGIIL